MHPWNTKYIPDIGKILYDHGHYLHHLSDNYNVWSGISMHPLEGFLYETAVVIPLLFTHHPLMLFFIKVDLSYKAILGHDGYDFPGASNLNHFIHHTEYDCNYGTSNAPFDLIFDTFNDGSVKWR